MQQDKDRKENTSNETDSKEENVVGRIHGANNPALKNEDSGADISSVDQQEGQMNNGELGGGLGAKE